MIAGGFTSETVALVEINLVGSTLNEGDTILVGDPTLGDSSYKVITGTIPLRTLSPGTAPAAPATPAAATEGAAALAATTEQAAKDASDNCNVVGTLSSLVDDATAELVKGMEDAANEMLGVAADITKAVNDAVAEINGLVDQATAAIDAKLNEIWNSINSPGGLVSDLTTAFNEFTAGLDQALNDIGAAISEVAGAIDTAIGEVSAAIGELTAELGNVVKKVSQAACAGVTAALGAVGAGISPDLDAIAGPAAAAAPPARGFQSNGGIVNFNIDKTLPYADVERNGSTIRLYGTAEQISSEYPEATIVQPEDADGKEEFDPTQAVTAAASGPVAGVATAASEAVNAAKDAATGAVTDAKNAVNASISSISSLFA